MGWKWVSSSSDDDSEDGGSAPTRVQPERDSIPPEPPASPDAEDRVHCGGEAPTESPEDEGAHPLVDLQAFPETFPDMLEVMSEGHSSEGGGMEAGSDDELADDSEADVMELCKSCIRVNTSAEDGDEGEVAAECAGGAPVAGGEEEGGKAAAGQQPSSAAGQGQQPSSAAGRRGPSGPRKSGEGTEDEEQGLLTVEKIPGGLQMRVTLLAAGFVIGAAGASVREIVQQTGACIQSWSEPAHKEIPRPMRVFRIQGSHKSVLEAARIIRDAVEQHKELCEGKRRGEYVPRQQRIRGVAFAYQPPPRAAAPQAAAIGSSRSAAPSATAASSASAGAGAAAGKHSVKGKGGAATEGDAGTLEAPVAQANGASTAGGAGPGAYGEAAQQERSNEGSLRKRGGRRNSRRHSLQPSGEPGFSASQSASAGILGMIAPSASIQQATNTGHLANSPAKGSNGKSNGGLSAAGLEQASAVLGGPTRGPDTAAAAAPPSGKATGRRHSIAVPSAAGTQPLYPMASFGGVGVPAHLIPGLGGPKGMGPGGSKGGEKGAGAGMGKGARPGSMSHMASLMLNMNMNQLAPHHIAIMQQLHHQEMALQGGLQGAQMPYSAGPPAEQAFIGRPPAASVGAPPTGMFPPPPPGAALLQHLPLHQRRRSTPGNINNLPGYFTQREMRPPETFAHRAPPPAAPPPPHGGKPHAGAGPGPAGQPGQFRSRMRSVPNYAQYISKWAANAGVSLQHAGGEPAGGGGGGGGAGRLERTSSINSVGDSSLFSITELGTIHTPVDVVIDDSLTRGYQAFKDPPRVVAAPPGFESAGWLGGMEAQQPGAGGPPPPGPPSAGPAIRGATHPCQVAPSAPMGDGVGADPGGQPGGEAGHPALGPSIELLFNDARGGPLGPPAPHQAPAQALSAAYAGESARGWGHGPPGKGSGLDHRHASVPTAWAPPQLQSGVPAGGGEELSNMAVVASMMQSLQGLGIAEDEAFHYLP